MYAFKIDFLLANKGKIYDPCEIIADENGFIFIQGDITQLVRVSASHAGSPRFESEYPHFYLFIFWRGGFCVREIFPPL